MSKDAPEGAPGAGPWLSPGLLVDPALPALPARSLLLVLMRSDQARLRVSFKEYAQRHGVSERTLYRFQQGEGKLPKPLRLALLTRHPRWKATMEAVILEDARRDDLATGPA